MPWMYFATVYLLPLCGEAICEDKKALSGARQNVFCSERKHEIGMGFP